MSCPALRVQVIVHLKRGKRTAAQLAADIGKSHGEVYAELCRMKGDGLVTAVQLRESGARWWGLK